MATLGGGLFNNGSDITVSPDRHIRMPISVLYLICAGVAASAWGYFDLKAQAEEAVKTGKANSQQLVEASKSLHMIENRQDKDSQKLDDFIDSSQRVYDRYFRSLGDPEYKKR